MKTGINERESVYSVSENYRQNDKQPTIVKTFINLQLLLILGQIKHHKKLILSDYSLFNLVQQNWARSADRFDCFQNFPAD